MNNYINEVNLSGKLYSIYECNDYTLMGIETTNYSKNNTKAYISLRIYKDLYNKYKDLFFINNFIYLKGYLNSTRNKINKIENYVMITKIFKDINDYNLETEGPYIRYDSDGTMVWNGKRCEKVLATKEEQEELNKLINEITGGKENE